MATSPIVRARLLVPAPRERAIDRKLIRQIGLPAPSKRLTLLTAPAGYGKTSLGAQWASLSDVATVWFSLDRTDNVTHRLLLHLVCAFELAGVIPVSVNHHRECLETTERLWARLLNGLLDYGKPVCLIMDGSECLTSQRAWEVIDDLVWKAPVNLSVIVSGRRKPGLNLMKALAADDLTEINNRELSFTVEEVEQVLEQRSLSMGTGDIYHLHSKTEGWPVGVLLFVAAFEKLGSRELLSSSDSRVYESAIQWVKDYLIREVVDCLPPELQSFILRTSHVNAFNEVLAAELTGDAQAKKSIEVLEQQRGLLTRTGHSEWRCYHPMFRAAFYLIAKERLGLEAVRLHEETATWFLRAGHFGEGLYHYARCKSVPSLLRLIEQHAFDLLRGGEVNDIFDTLLTIPVTVSQDHYVLAMIEASVVHVSKDVQRINACIKKLQMLSKELPGSANPVRIRQTIAFLKSQNYYLGGNLQKGIYVCSDELKLVPLADPLNAALSVLRFHRANGYHALGDLDRAYEDAQQAYDELEQLELSGYTNSISMLLGQIELSQGQLEKAEQRFRGAVIDRCLPGSVPGVRNFYDVFSIIGLGLVRREQNRFEEAMTLLAEAANIAHKFTPSAALPSIFHHIALTAWAQGDKSRARELFREGQRLAKRNGLDIVYRLLGAYRVRLDLDDEGVSGEYAEMWASESAELVRTGKQDVMPEEWLSMAWFEHYRGNTSEALRGCEEVTELTRSNGQIDLLIDSLLLKASILRAGGKPEEAMEQLNVAISVSRDNGMRSLFFREGRGLIDLCKAGVSRKRSEEKDLAAPFSDAPFVQELLTTQIEASVDVYRTPKLQLFEPITKRERDVLGLMTKGVSNQEIADALFVSVSTVKSHINSIFKKLEVSTREEAGELASQFQLLG